MAAAVRNIEVQHYKSLSSVSLDGLGPITLLVGPNAVGKSNVVDAVRFLRDAVVDGLDHAVSKRSGIAVIRQYSPTRPYQISIRLSLDTPTSEDRSRSATYWVKIGSQRDGNFRVELEEASWHDEEFELDEKSDSWQPAGIRAHHFRRNAVGELVINGEKAKRPLQPDQLALGTERFKYSPLGLPISQLISRFRFSALYPNTLRSPSRPVTDRILNETGENWASVLKGLRQTVSGKRALSRIMELMRLVVPSLQEVTVKGVGGYLVPQFRVKEEGRSRGHDFDPVQLSDGTLRIFGLLLTLYQVPAPRLLAIEEPEQTVHPGVLPMLADAFKEVSDRTQLLITTHSPHFVDYFSPRDIRVVSMSRGNTDVSRIKKSQLESVKERLISLQELMGAEGLLPEEAS